MKKIPINSNKHKIKLRISRGYYIHLTTTRYKENVKMIIQL